MNQTVDQLNYQDWIIRAILDFISKRCQQYLFVIQLNKLQLMQKFLKYQQAKNYQTNQNSIMQSITPLNQISTRLESTKINSVHQKNNSVKKLDIDITNDQLNQTFQIAQFLNSNKQNYNKSYSQQFNQIDLTDKSLKATKSQCLQQKHLEISPKLSNKTLNQNNNYKFMIQNREIEEDDQIPDSKKTLLAEMQLIKECKYLHRRTRAREFKISEKFYSNPNQLQKKFHLLNQYEMSQKAEKIPLKLGVNHHRNINNKKDIFQFIPSPNKKTQRLNKRKNIHSLSVKNEQNIKKQINKSIQNRRSIDLRNNSNSKIDVRTNSSSKKKKILLTLNSNLNNLIVKQINSDISQNCF